MIGQPYTPFPATRSSPFVPMLPSTVETTVPLSGAGSPEGVVPGMPGLTYTDNAANQNGNSDLWVKLSGVQATGWIRVGEVVPCSL